MTQRGAVPLLVVVALLVPLVAAAARTPLYDQMLGEEREYVVVPGDNIWGITGRFTMSRDLFNTLNPLAEPDRLMPGMRFRVSDRHIVPQRGRDGVVIDLSSRTLYWFAAGKLRARFPVGIGRVDSATPPGRYRVVGRRADPAWRVPASIQEEMRARGEKVVSYVEPGPDNPLGRFWIQLSAPGYGLHGTNAPSSIGKYSSHGCLRLLPDNIEWLFHNLPDGTRVDVLYEPVKIAQDLLGGIFLEVHRDVYQGAQVDFASVLATINDAGVGERVDPSRVAEVVARAWGIPEDVTLHAITPAPPVDIPVAEGGPLTPLAGGR